MHMVAPIWRVAALMIPLASLVGCDWLPVRRRIDPALYPVPARPDPALIRGHRTLPPVNSGENPNPTALAGMPDNRPFPPLPELVPVSPDDLFDPPAPTPMLDAALVRAQAIETAVFDENANRETEQETESPDRDDPVGDAHVLESEATDRSELNEPDDSLPISVPEMVEVPPTFDGLPNDLDPPESIEVDPEREDLHALKAIEPTPTGETPETHLDEQGVSSLPRLLEDAREQIARGEENEAVLTSPDHLLNQIAEPKVQGQIDDPDLWQTVMRLLAESESDPEIRTIDDGSLQEVGRSFQIVRIAFCREVLGFDQIIPFDPEVLHAGQKILIYSEMEGVHYLPESDGHVSRLSTTLEILDEEESSALWSNVMPVEDHCRRPRLDYFVGYRLALPESLAPGRYRLRVVQRDVLSGQEDVAETPFAIVSEGR